MNHGCSWLITACIASHCISYRYDDGSTDQLEDDWESEDGVTIFSPRDDTMGFLFRWCGWSEDADTNF